MIKIVPTAVNTTTAPNSNTATTNTTNPSKQSTQNYNDSKNQKPDVSPISQLKNGPSTNDNKAVLTVQGQTKTQSTLIMTTTNPKKATAGKYDNYDPNGLSDDEDNSWADELSNSGASGGGADDDYYGEEDGEYGDESVMKHSKVQDDSTLQVACPDENGYSAKKKSNKKVCINVYCTEYDVVKKVAKRVCNYKLKELEEDHEGAVVKGQGNQKLSPVWDISWHDLAITPDYMSKMHSYQKVNHFPGMYVVCRKNFLARNLMKMQRQFPEEYSFFPKTWLLPSEQIEFRNQFQSIGANGKANPKPPKKKTYIVKPEALSQGKGIFLSRSFDEIMDSCQTEGCVVQEYITKPYLIEDLKFDLRIYVMLYGVNPLRIYFHEMGLARFATEEYQKPGNSNLDNLYMHLTNYAINKFNSKFQQNEDSDEDDQGHKRSLNAILCLVKKEGHDPEKLLKEIKDIIVKTLVIGQPYLSHLYKSCQPECLDNSMCFQVLGFDIILDSNCKPWLLEVNQSPSFSTDSPLDYKIKKQVLGDAFNLLNCSYDRRQDYIKNKKEEMEKRIMTGKTLKIGGEDKEKLRQEKLKERFEYEKSRTGGYELIFPSPDETMNKQYEAFIQKANDLWDDFTTGGKNKKANAANGFENKKGSINQAGPRNQSKLQHMTTVTNNTMQRRVTQVQAQSANMVYKLTTQKDLLPKHQGEVSNKTSARETMKQLANINQLSNQHASGTGVVGVLVSQTQNSKTLQAQNSQSNLINDQLSKQIIQESLQNSNQGQIFPINGAVIDDRTTSTTAFEAGNDLMIESISHDITDRTQNGQSTLSAANGGGISTAMINPKLRMSGEKPFGNNNNSQTTNNTNTIQNALQNPYLIYNKTLQQSQKLRESFQIQPSAGQIQQQQLMSGASDVVGAYKDLRTSGSGNSYQIIAKKSQDQMQEYQDQQLNVSQDMKHNKANSLILQSQNQIIQKSANFSTVKAANNSQKDNSKQIAQDHSPFLHKTEPSPLIYSHTQPPQLSYQPLSIINRHQNGNRVVINQILQGLQADQQIKQHLISNSIPHRTQEDSGTRHTPTLKEKGESGQFQTGPLYSTNSNDVLKAKRKQFGSGSNSHEVGGSQSRQPQPLPYIQHQQQQQVLMQQILAQQQSQPHHQNLQQQLQQNQPQAQMIAGQAMGNRTQYNHNLMQQFSMARNTQQKSGTLIQISSMPIYVGNQNLFTQSQKFQPDSPNKRTPLPDLSGTHSFQQSATNRNSSINQQRLLIQQRQLMTNNSNGQQQTQNTTGGASNSINGKKGSTSALSHSPSVRPVASKGYQSGQGNPQPIHSHSQAQSAKVNSHASALFKAKQSSQHYNGIIQQQQQYSSSGSASIPQTTMAPVGISGMSLMSSFKQSGGNAASVNQQQNLQLVLSSVPIQRSAGGSVPTNSNAPQGFVHKKIIIKSERN